MIRLKKLLEEGSPGYENRQFGDSLPTLNDITKKYQEKNGVVKEESINEDMDYVPAKYSNPEAKQQLDSDVTAMSKILGKASQQIIKIMMDGVKGGKYDALDIIRGIETGRLNRTHEGERPFMKMLWRKVRSGFRRYMPKGKLRK